MEREQIVREDFPTARKGWSPDAVRAHLTAVAEAFADARAKQPSVAATATSERVERVIAAAEEAAAEILTEARAESDRILGAARAEAAQIRAAAQTESQQAVTAANREASGRVEQARGAVEGLIAQADRLRTQVGALGRDFASNVPGSGVSAEAPIEAAADEPLVVPDPVPEPTTTDDELIAQLRGSGKSAVAEEAADQPASTISGPDQRAARLVAMNMALDGASRDEIARQINTEFGSVANVDDLLDDVLRRANR